MPIIAKESSSTPRNPAPQGLWPAVCVDVVDRGMQTTPWGEKHKVLIIWQIDQIDPDTEKRYEVAQQYGLSLAPMSNLRKMCESWRGKEFSEQELRGFDLEKLVKAPCQLQITHRVVGEAKTYANVQAIVPAGPVKLEPLDYERRGSEPTVEEEEEALPF